MWMIRTSTWQFSDQPIFTALDEPSKLQNNSGELIPDRNLRTLGVLQYDSSWEETPCANGLHCTTRNTSGRYYMRAGLKGEIPAACESPLQAK